MRPYQWSKNLFILAPAFFGFGQYAFGVALLNLAFAFIAFCAIASGVYVLNDIIDAKTDKLHPLQKSRPIPSGKIKKRNALIFAFILIFSAFMILQIGGGHNKGIFIAFGIYLLLNLAYSLKLKYIAILDIFIIASGFVIRLFIGANTINVPLSHWIIITTFLLALFLALAKRRDDVILLESGIKARHNIDGYNRTFLDIAMGICGSLVMVTYIFYSIDEGVNARFGTHNLYFTSVFVLLGIFRYMQLAFVKNDSSDPSKILLKDRFLQLTILAWVASFVGIVAVANL